MTSDDSELTSIRTDRVDIDVEHYHDVHLRYRDRVYRVVERECGIQLEVIQNDE